MIPIIASISYALGGDGRIPYLFIKGANAKLWRWLMGIPISLIALVFGHGIYSLLCIPGYFIATNAFPYGEKSWLNPLGEYGKFAVCGAVFGANSFFIIPWYFALVQTLFSVFAFVLVKYLDDKNIVKQPWVELLRGGMGTLFI